MNDNNDNNINNGEMNKNKIIFLLSVTIGAILGIIITFIALWSNILK